MSYDSKMSAMEAILADHNKAITLGEIGRARSGTEIVHIPSVDIQGVKNKLIHLGATSETALSQCSFEDLEGCGIPKLLAKTVAQVFRNGPEPEKAHKDGWVSERTAERMSFEELISRYSPIHENAINKKLGQISKGAKFIAFAQGNQVDVAVTLKLLQELHQGFGERPLGAILVDGSMKQIYKVGEKPDNLVDENPLYPGRALRPDGTCDQLNRSWDGVPLSVRQVIYLAARESKELSSLSIAGAHDILDRALLDVSDNQKLQQFGARYPKAFLLFSEKLKTSSLPSIRIELGKQTNKVVNQRVTIIS